MQPLRLGLIGCGQIAQLVHIPLLRRLPEAKVVAISDIDERLLDTTKKQLPGAKSYLSPEALLVDPDVEAVLICLPNDLHAPVASAALSQGKHVYLEKPLASTIEQGLDLLNAAKRSEKVAMCGFNFRFNPLVLKAKEFIASGKLGRLVAVRMVFSTESQELPEWKRSRSTGGGVLLDLASHHIDLVRFMLGQEIVDATATLNSISGEEDNAFLDLEVESGLIVQGFYSMSAVADDRWEVYGTEGLLAFDRFKGAHVEFYPLGYKPSVLGAVLKDLEHAPAILRKLKNPGYEPSYKECLGTFIAAARTNKHVHPDFEDGYKTLLVIDKAERSPRSKKEALVARVR